jgi:hypothetical protein
MNFHAGAQPSEADLLRLFNQFLQQGGSNIDVSKLNIELKISKKENDESVGVMTLQMDPSPKPEVQVKVEVTEELAERETNKERELVDPDELSPIEPTLRLESDGSKTIPSMEPKLPSFGGMSSIEKRHEEKADLLKRGKSAKEEKIVVSQNSGDSHGVHNKTLELIPIEEEDFKRIHQHEVGTKNSVRALASENDSQSILSNIVVEQFRKEGENEECAPTTMKKANLISKKMEEIYLNEIKSFNSNQEKVDLKRRKSRSVRISYSPTRCQRRLPLFAGQSSSSKTLFEYIEIKEKLDRKEEKTTLHFNMFGEQITFPQVKNLMKESLPKYKSMVPVVGPSPKETPTSSPIENEDDDQLQEAFWGDVTSKCRRTSSTSGETASE